MGPDTSIESGANPPVWVEKRGVELGAVPVLLTLVAGLGLFSPNPLESAWSLFLLWLILKWFWWRNHPPLLVYAAVIPWLEIHTTVLEANIYGLTLDGLFLDTGRQTFWMASAGLLMVMTGLRFALRSWRRSFTFNVDFLREEAEKINQIRLLAALFGVRFLSGFVKGFVGFGSLRQLSTYFDGIAGVLSVCIFLHYFITRKRPLLFYGFFLFELVGSFYSYFGSWKAPLFLLFLTTLWNTRVVTRRALIRFLPAAALVGTLLFVWQSIKVEYRAFLSGETRDQIITVGRTEALSKFLELSLESFSAQQAQLESVQQSTLRRVGYLEYYSAAVANVPEFIPFEGGELLKESLNFALVPRFLNPSKGVKSDREKVERYTEFNFGDENNKASFSLGHYCEAYIDWGPIGSLIQLLVYGIIGGYLYHITMKRYAGFHPFIIIGMLWVILFPWATMQQDAITVIGKTTWGAICHLWLFKPLYSRLQTFIQS